MRRAAWGIVRSLVVYWRPGRQRSLRRLYRSFVEPGDLVFDVGAHLGDRTAAFSGLGARVVALEPQPHLIPWLRLFVGRRPGVIVRTEALGRAPGRALLAVSEATPTVSTLDAEWRDRIPRSNPGFARVRWDRDVEVTVTTLDALIEEHGVPRFCKLDVEGHEAEVLAGLSRPIEGLSVEFVAGGLHVAEACVARLAALGPYRFNAIGGEGRDFALSEWVGAADVLEWLRAGADGASSGDLYARLADVGVPDQHTEESMR